MTLPLDCALDVFTVLSKRDAEVRADFLSKSVVEDGRTSALTALAAAKYFETLAKAIKDDEDIKEQALKELHDSGEKLYKVYGVSYSEHKSTSYDYKNSPAWRQLKSEEEHIATKRKEVEAKAKATTLPTTHIMEESGEELAVLPAIMRQSESVNVKLPKDREEAYG